METTKFFGHDCSVLENQTLRLLVTRSIGPRILWLSRAGGENLLAELPHFTTECPGHGAFHFYGGHRLWVAPEDVRRTYLPDDDPVAVVEVESGLRATQDVEPETRLQKSLEIRLSNDQPQVTITHTLVNRGLQIVTCAPWAITQFRTGGVAILPQAREDTKVLPNRSLALWPYSDMSNPNVTWGRHHVLVSAPMDAPFKIGFPNPRGWLAYWLDGTLFVKRAAYDSNRTYFDFGSSSECYCNGQFLELETLAPICNLQPGESVTHVETWRLYENVSRPRNEEDVRGLIERLGLE
ncbi:MAG: hypothetical protein AB1750_05145 [Chloroflexota bacterium]